jgi:hypothetical protein
MFTGAESGPAVNPPFLLDTVAFVDMGERFYPLDVFTGLWTELLAALNTGRVVTLRGVIAELKRGPQDPWRALVYAATKSHLIDDGGVDVQRVFGRVAPALFVGSLTKRLSEVDVLLLSSAEAHNCPFITRDTKMLNACACNGGPVQARPLSLADMFRELGWRFA